MALSQTSTFDDSYVNIDNFFCHNFVFPNIPRQYKYMSSEVINFTRSSADADNGLDAFSGQSRSTNMVPFWVHCDFSLRM